MGVKFKVVSYFEWYHAVIDCQWTTEISYELVASYSNTKSFLLCLQQKAYDCTWLCEFCLPTCNNSRTVKQKFPWNWILVVLLNVSTHAGFGYNQTTVDTWRRTRTGILSTCCVSLAKNLLEQKCWMKIMKKSETIYAQCTFLQILWYLIYIPVLEIHCTDLNQFLYWRSLLICRLALQEIIRSEN